LDKHKKSGHTAACWQAKKYLMTGSAHPKILTIAKNIFTQADVFYDCG
jgi:hypothetical protein